MKSFLTWRKTISGKLTTIYVIIFVLVLLALNMAVYFGLLYFINGQARESLNNTLDFLEKRLYQFETYDTELVEELSRSEQNMYFRILSNNKSIRFQSQLLEGINVPIVQGYQDLHINGRHFIYKTNLILDRGIFIGYIQVVREMTAEGRFLRWLLTIMVITSLLGMIAAILTGSTVSRRMLKQITSITETAKEISGSDIGKRLEIEGPEDEISDLANTFNSMLDRLENAFQQQRQFVSDASHELRTPISVVQGYANLLDRWGKEEKEVRDEAIDAIKKETENMKSLVESLLFLARGDDNRIELNYRQFFADELAREIIHETEMISNKVDIYSDRLDKVLINADRDLIKQMLRIFIDNSIKYTPVSGDVIINLIKNKDNVEFVIKDSGIGIPQEEIPHIFERFYRVDKSRSEKNGTGLGLSIAKWIVRQHDGEINVESSPGEGTKISVGLPL
ncbi:MAG: sensor histidine kinase [Bacillota bacterium]